MPSCARVIARKSCSSRRPGELTGLSVFDFSDCSFGAIGGEAERGGKLDFAGAKTDRPAGDTDIDDGLFVDPGTDSVVCDLQAESVPTAVLEVEVCPGFIVGGI